MRNPASRGALLVGLAACVAAGSGCVTGKPMALSRETPPFTLGPQQSLALATVKVANVHKTGYQPHGESVVVKTTGAKEEVVWFELGAPFRASEAEAAQFEEFLVSFALAPGSYELSRFVVSAGPLPIRGWGELPVDSMFQMLPGKAVYLGRIEAVRRERRGDEPRAGSLFPLIDQSITGFSDGTFDVRLYDGYDYDLSLMRAAFPALKDVPVERAFLKAKAPTPQPNQPERQARQ